MKRLTLLLLPVSIILLSGTCQRATTGPDNNYLIPVTGSVNFTINFIEREIIFDSVVMDNRCPPNVNCIVAGEGVCRFIVRSGSESHPVTLSTMPGGTGAARYPREAQVSGMNVRLETLIPLPKEAYSAYRAQVLVTPL